MSPFGTLHRRSIHGCLGTLLPLLVRATVVVTLLLASAVGTSATAQTPGVVAVVSDTLMEVRLQDGSVLFGRIVAADDERITILTEAGTRIELQRAQIHSIRRNVARLVNGERWFDDPNATRLFFGPTGRAIGRGTGYFAVYELFMPFLSYGITDQFSISGGTPVIPGAIGKLFYAAPKLTVLSRPGVDLAAGVLAFLLPDDGESLGMFYGVGTFGSLDNAFTAGLGVPFYVGDESEIVDRFAVMLGGEARVSRRTKMIGESYFVPGESGALLMGGLRFFGERLSADAGLGLAVGEGDSACCLPIVNFVWVFGRQK